MNKKLLTIAIALVILAMVVAPVAAQLPAKSPLPSGKPFENIWTFLQDLQNQIKNIPAGAQGPAGPQGPAGVAGATGATGAQGPAGTSNVVTVSGNVQNGEIVTVPSGFTRAQCVILVSPGDIYCPMREEWLYRVSASYTGISESQWRLYAGGLCRSYDLVSSDQAIGSANYMIICKS